MADGSMPVTASMRKICENCGGMGLRKVKGLCAPCGAKSRAALRQEYRRAYRGAEGLAPLLKSVVSKKVPVCHCIVCGVEFKPKGNDRTTCCSRECGFKLTHFRASGGRVSHSVYRVRCKACGVRGEARRGAHSCKDCIEQRNRQEPKHPDLGKVRSCKICAADYHVKSKYSPSMFCSKPCRNAHKRMQPWYQEMQKQAKARRRARKKGALKIERIGPRKVFERDDWRCGICNRKTLKSKRGLPHPRAPELDHIVALANGGSHTWDNVQCSCRECNGRKGASDYGQMLLFPKP